MEMDQKSMQALIQNVRERRSLWDPQKLNIPGIKAQQSIEWSSLGKLHNSSGTELKEKWQALRASFSKILKRIPKNENKKFSTDPAIFKCDWPYFQQMLFLVNPKDIATTEPLETRKIKTEKRRLDAADVSPVKRQRLNVDVNPVDLKSESDAANASEEIDNSLDDYNPVGTQFDSDHLFLLSFHECLKPMSLVQKLKVRAAISTTIAEIVANEMELAHSEIN